MCPVCTQYECPPIVKGMARVGLLSIKLFYKKERSDMSFLATTPTPQTADWWYERHQQKCLETECYKKLKKLDSIELVFLGDSITQAWENFEPSKVWDQFYQHRGALNLGFAGDRTEHLLWRIENGELDGLSPRLVVLLIGTNNTGHRLDAADDTANAIQVILAAIKNKLPQTKTLLLALFPRSAKPTQRLRILNNDINQLIHVYADNKTVFFLDIGAYFLNKEERLDETIMNDFLHLNADQYQVWAEAMEPTIQQLFDESEVDQI